MRISRAFQPNATGAKFPFTNSRTFLPLHLERHTLGIQFVAVHKSTEFGLESTTRTRISETLVGTVSMTVS